MTKFLALFVGEPTGGPPADMDPAMMEKGMQAWGDWMQTNGSRIVEQGGPLGRTKKVSRAGISDIRNKVGGYVVIEAEDAEAAAKLFEGHPHFMIFPGEAVEVMPVLPIPGM